MPLYDRTVAGYWLESLGWDGRFQKTSLALGARVASREPLGKGSGSVCSLYCPCLINAPARNGLDEFLRVPEIPEYKQNLSPPRRNQLGDKATKQKSVLYPWEEGETVLNPDPSRSHANEAQKELRPHRTRQR